MANQRLQLTWYNKDKALIPIEAGRYGYMWVDPADPRYCETRCLVFDEYVEGEPSAKTDDFEYSGRADFEPQHDNLLVLGETREPQHCHGVITHTLVYVQDKRLLRLNAPIYLICLYHILRSHTAALCLKADA